MTMHLARGLSTLNTKKSKKKPLTAKQVEKYKTEMHAYNKRMRQQHCHDMQMNLEEFIASTYGKPKSRTTQSKKDTYIEPKVYRRETPSIPSAGIGTGGFTPRKEPQKYTGDLIVGIATMHKSNAVPVMRGTKQAEEIAKMRRG